MSFHDTQFPSTIVYGPSGGSRFKTRIVQNPGGYEQRNIDWVNPLGKWSVAHEMMTQSELDTIVAFFHARYGRAHTFRFKAWEDYKARMDDSESLPTIHTVTSSPNLPDTQLIKNYTSGGYTYVRNITLPVSGTVVLYADGAEIGDSNYSVDYTTGIVDWEAAYAPGVGVVITADYQFDVLARFDTDEIESSIDYYDRSSWTGIQVVEVRS